MDQLASGAPRILIVDDQPDVLDALRLLLKGGGYVAVTATTPAQALSLLESSRFDVLVMDLNYARDTTSGQEGLGLLNSVRSIDAIVPVIVLTGWATLDLVVESLRSGVSDFIQKPWDNARLLSVLRTQAARSRRMREDSRRQLEAEHQMEEAREIQRCFVPQRIPRIPGCRVAVAWQPSGALSGDYYDVLQFGDQRFGLCIADVVGKGVPAALLMSSIQANVRSFAHGDLPPKVLCEKLNEFLCLTIAENKFITFFYALLDARKKTLRYVNAGHNAPILVHRDGTHVRLTEGGGVLGVCPEWRYEEGEIVLGSGDRLLCFTDGLSEAQDLNGEEFGEQKLINMMRDNLDADPEELQSAIMGSVTRFCAAQPQDDATLIAIGID
ncbi:MAG TPA: SpoIIE family protein phosphatase [Gemmatimonadales bacterium]|nr:SpoIIE family protein phosphatase [Gemmatimonadales bacterium]